MEDDFHSWSSLDLEDYDKGSCSDLQVCQSSESLLDGPQFEETEKRYADILSEVREMRRCLSPLEETARKPPKEDVPTESDVSDYLDEFSDPYLQHAMKRMRRLDLLLDLLAEKEREARHNTSKLQLQLRKKIEAECDSKINSEVFKRHTQKFLSLCPPAVEEKKSEKGKQNKQPDFLLEVIPEEPSGLEERSEGSTGGGDSGLSKEEGLKEPDKLKISVTRKSPDCDVSRKKTSQKFIERNKKLVSDNHTLGIPCMTEKERNHLDKLLENLTCVEIEEPAKPQTSDNEDDDDDKSEGFGISMQKRQSLQGIDSKLEVLSSERDPQQDNDQFYLKEEDQERGWKELQMKQRLKEINQSLTAITEAALQQIEPIDEHQIQKLLGKSEESSSTCLTSSQTLCSCSSYSSLSQSIRSVNPLPPERPNTPTSHISEDIEARLDSSHPPQVVDIISSETLSKVVEETKNQLPGFLYRYTKYFDTDEDVKNK